MKWKQIDPRKHSWQSEVIEEDEGSGFGHYHDPKFVRYFVPEGKRSWPLLSISAMSSFRREGYDGIVDPGWKLHVGCSIKSAKDAFWVEHPVPKSMLPLVHELFNNKIEALLGSEVASR